VLLHGLGETGDARAGAYAFWERYGLPSAYARLLAPPVVRTSNAGYFTDAALLRVNEKLRERPFGPLAFLCPHVPNLQSPVQVAPFAAWLVEKALPAARAQFSDAGTPVEKVLLAGCSLGAFIAFETFLAAPGAFVAVAGVQSAIGAAAAPRYAAAFAKAGLAGERIYLSTSSGDPYREPTRGLGAALRAQGVAPEMHEAPGPHDQPWLREVGTVELMLALHRAAGRA
jgi:pimeloyl-ACP methyl ester carboxylesterase